MQAPHRIVSELEQRWEHLETAFHEAYWRSQTHADAATDRRRAELELEVRRAKGDAAALATVEDALETVVQDEVLRRQLEVLRLSLTANQMSDADRERLVALSTAVESDFASHRAEVNGRRMTDNEIEDVLETSDDEDLRRRAWEASKGIGAVVAERVRELARLRNAVARGLGFADHYQMALELQEIPETWLLDVLAELESLTEEPYRGWKRSLDERVRERHGVDEPMPWHYADPFFQRLPRDGRVDLDPLLGAADASVLAVTTFAGWGMDLHPVLAHSDLRPRERKCQHAFCLDVDRAGDVRVLANVVPGERWIGVMLHEFGHAAYDVGIDGTLPYLLRRPAHTFVTEAIAIACGRLVHDPAWLREIANVSVGDVEAVAAGLRRARAAQAALFARWGLVMVHFERALYADPEDDLDARWWELVERFQLLRRPTGRSAPDWAAKIHLAVAPVYYHNYILGELLASQIRATCERECGGFIGNQGAGELLAERVFMPGASLRWDAVVTRATGSALGAGDFAADMVPLGVAG